MSRTEFNKAMMVLTRYFPDKFLDTDAMWIVLNDLSIKQIEESVMQIVKTETEINKATNLVALIRKHATPKNGLPPPSYFNQYKPDWWDERKRFATPPPSNIMELINKCTPDAQK